MVWICRSKISASSTVGKLISLVVPDIAGWKMDPLSRCMNPIENGEAGPFSSRALWNYRYVYFHKFLDLARPWPAGSESQIGGR